MSTSEEAKRKDRSIGSFVGLAIGDALGAPIQFKRRDTYEHVTGYTAGGTYNLEPGVWTDDTSMAICLAESLLEHGGYVPADFGKRLVRWVDEGYNSSLPKCFDIGQTTLRAIGAFKRFGPQDCGITGKWAGGNGSIMRLAPIPLFYQEFPDQAEEVAVYQGTFTHNHEVPNDSCRLLSKIIVEAIRSGSKTEALRVLGGSSAVEELTEITDRKFEFKDRTGIQSDGYVVSTLEAAIWSVWRTDSFRDALLTAVNLGDDADTVGAVAGQIAGALYGVNQIPGNWVSGLFESDRILDLGRKLFDQRQRP